MGKAKDPAASATKERAKRAVDKKEAPKKKPNIHGLKKQAEKLSSDPNVKAAEAIRKLKGNVETAKQLKGLTYLYQALDKVLIKLAKKDVELEKVRTAKDLEREVIKNGIKLSLVERVALENLDRLLSEPGETSRAIEKHWDPRIKAAKEASKGIHSKAWEYAKKNKMATALFVVTGIAGIMLGYSAIKKIIKKSSDGGKDSWLSKDIMLPLMVMLAAGATGTALSMSDVKKIFAKRGLDHAKMQAKAKAGKPFTKGEQGKLKKVGKDIKDKVDKARKKEEATTAAPAPGVSPETTPPSPELLENAEKKRLREFGEKLLTDKGAHKLTGGAYLITTGKRNVWFKFGEAKGKWHWQSETEKKKNEWVLCGTDDYYNEKTNPDTKEVNAIAKKLGEEAGVSEKKEDEQARKKGKSSEVSKKGAEALKAGKYDVAKKAFLAIYFNPRHHKPHIFNDTINDISQVKFETIKALFKKHESSKKIAKSELPSIKSEISEEHLFLLLEKMVKFSKLGHADIAKEKVTVQIMLESVMQNPMAEQLEGMNTAVLSALKEGDIGDALKGLAAQGVENMKSKATEMAERLNKVLGIDTEKLNKEEKFVYQQMQAILMTNPTLIKHEPKYVIDSTLRTHSKFKKHPKAIELATQFFTKIKKKSPPILERAIKKFEIKSGDINYLRQGANMDNLIAFNACELILLDQALEGKGDQATDLLILGVLIRSIHESHLRNRYIGQVSDEVTKDVPSINIPGLKSLQPYFKKAIKMAGSYFGYKILDQMHRWSPYQTQHPTAKDHDKMAETFKSQNIVFGSLKEVGGTTLELTSDTLAAIVLAFPGMQEHLASCDTGKEFLDLIRVNGGHISTYKDRDGTLGILIDTGYEMFLARPSAILYESISSAIQGEFGDAAKIWVGGSSFFVGAGAIKGAFTTYNVAGGKIHYRLLTRAWNAIKFGARGLKYPYKAPIMAWEAGSTFAKGLVTGLEAGTSMAKAPVRGGRRVLNWTKDVLRYGLPDQNIENMVDTGRLLQKHFKNASSAGDLPQKAGIRARAGRALRRSKAILREPGTNFRQMMAGDWHWSMAKKFAERFAGQYNNLLGLDDISGFNPEKANTEEIVKNLKNASERLDEFLTKVKKDPDLVKKIRDAAKRFGKGEALQTELKAILQNCGLNPDEIRAFAQRINSKGMAKKVTEQLERAASRLAGTKATEAARPGAFAKLRARFRKPGAAPDVPDSGPAKAGKLGKTAEKIAGDILEVQKKIKVAENEIGLLNRMRSTTDKRIINGIRKKLGLKPSDGKGVLTKRLETARQIVAEGRAAEIKLSAATEALKKLDTAQEAVDIAKKAGVGADYHKAFLKLKQAKEEAKTALEASDDIAKNMAKLGKWGTAAKYAGRSVAVLGAGMYALEASSAFWEAGSTDIAERRNVRLIEGGIYTAAAAADTAAVFVLFGSTSSAATVGSAFAAPLIPITYAASTIGETYYETTKTDYEWIQKGPSAGLHHFYTSVNSVSLGDAWTGAFKAMGRSPMQIGMTMVGGSIGAAVVPLSWETKGQKDAWDQSYAESVKNKVGTMNKIYRGLAAMQNDPNDGKSVKLIDYLNDPKHPPSDAKNKEIEKLIKRNYSKYHEFYFRQMWPSQMTSYESARKFVLEAQMFHDIMTMRDKAKANKQAFRIGGKEMKWESKMKGEYRKSQVFNLEKDFYNIDGGVENPTCKNTIIPSQIVAAYKQDAEVIFRQDSVEWTNLERMDTAYLLRLCAQTHLILSDPKKKAELKEDQIKALAGSFNTIQKYLEIVRGINFTLGIRNRDLREPLMGLTGLLEHLKSARTLENKAFLDYEKADFNMTPAMLALYRLGEYFGYTGPPSHDKLKEFFNENSKEYRGLYWDGSSWYLHERGNEFDDEMGSELTTALITKIIKRMREQPDNILKHRSDTIFLDAYDYSWEVKTKMAGALQAGLQEGEARGYKGDKRKAKLEHDEDHTVAPVIFNPKKLDYSLSAEKLKEDYKRVIDYTVKQTLWNNLDYKITSEDHIKLSRKDGGSVTNLHREGKTWRVGNKEAKVAQGLSLVQAVALGNLTNWAEQWIKKEGIEPGDPNPFEVDGNEIQYDTDDIWLDVDTTFMKHWNEFYHRIGLSQKRCVDVLNHFFGY